MGGTKLLIPILIAVGAILAILASLPNSPINPFDPSNPYISPSECFSLSAQECLASQSCIPVYGPSYCTGEVCTLDLRYKGCRLWTQEEKNQLAQNQPLCESTSGSWRYDPAYKRGQCYCPQGSDFTAYGCESLESQCQRTGGEVKYKYPPSHELYSPDAAFCQCPAGTLFLAGQGCQ